MVDATAQAGVPTLSAVNTVGSLIARTTKLGVYLNAGRENAVASTKAFTSQVRRARARARRACGTITLRLQVTVLALVACWFRQLHEERDPNVEPNPEKVETFAARGRAQLCL